jgi:hypothetical protein
LLCVRSHHDLAHKKPPPPSPPSPPPPPPVPNPPLAPLPPAQPPFATLRIWGPELLATPETDEDGRFAITCAIEGCAAPLPVFKSSSQVAIVQKISQLASDGVLARSVCPFECAREVSSHGLGFDAFPQKVANELWPQMIINAYTPQTVWVDCPTSPVLSDEVVLQNVLTATKDNCDGDGNLGGYDHCLAQPDSPAVYG